ncbi:MAG: hypothetical protein LUG65_01950 [Clostridiales bacterium]|nr:hypothetical protein [Clostridiales bacterium]
MALNLTRKDREWLEGILAQAEPYPPDAPELCVFDGEQSSDFYARWNATMAQKFLAQDALEKQGKL